ncbi:hypothetical protein Tco_0477460, partial [Tanacetum coccineum]
MISEPSNTINPSFEDVSFVVMEEGVTCKDEAQNGFFVDPILVCSKVVNPVSIVGDGNVYTGNLDGNEFITTNNRGTDEVKLDVVIEGEDNARMDIDNVYGWITLEENHVFGATCSLNDIVTEVEHEHVVMNPTLLEGVIMESLMKKKQKGVILELKQRHLKNTIFCTYTSYPAMRIQHISASSAQEM